MGLREGRQRFTGNLVAQYGLQLAKYIIPFLTLPYLARVLGSDAYAVRAYVLSLMTFVQVFLDCGFNLSASKDVIQARSKGRRIDEIVGNVLVAKIVLIVVGATAVAVITTILPILRDNALYVAIAYCAVAFNSLCPDFVYIGSEDMKPLTYRYVASKTICLLLTLAFVKTSSDLLLVPMLDVATSLIALGWTWVGIRKKYRVRFTVAKPKSTFETLKSSLLYFVSNASSSVHNSFLTLIIGVAAVSQSEIAYWSVMITAISAVQSLYSPIGNALYPHMVARKDAALVKRLFLISIPAVTLGCILFAALAQLIMALLGGEDYTVAYPLLQMLSPVLWFSFFGMLCGWPVLGAFGKVKEMTASTALGAVFVIIASVLLLSLGLLTIQSAVIVRVVSEAIVCVMRCRYSLPILKARGKGP